MDWIWRFAVRVTIAVLVGAAFHAAWVALFILAVSHGASGILRAMLWLIAPIVTAIGFGLGLTLLRRHDPRPKTGFGRAFVIALAGCAIGAVVMSPIGPMFVGFGVLGGGTVAVAIWVASDRAGRGQVGRWLPRRSGSRRARARIDDHPRTGSAKDTHMTEKRPPDAQPAAVARLGWRYHHLGIPYTVPRADEQHLDQLGVYVCGFETSPYGIEWMRFEAHCKVPEIVKAVPHVAFAVDNLDEALNGKEILIAPTTPSAGVRVAFILDNGAPVELLQFDHSEQMARTNDAG